MRLEKRLLQSLEGRPDRRRAFPSGQPHVELEGMRRVRVEQHRGLAAYGPELVVVRCAGAELFVRGSSLTLESMSLRELRLRGQIFALEFRY